MTQTSKTLILIRHAQSAENVTVHHVCEGISSIRNCCLPSWKALESLGGLLSLVESNPKLSKLGTRQIKDMHMILRDADFWTRFRPDIVVCSPLTRAQETCQGVLPPINGSTDLKVEIMADLTEASPYEHVFSKTLMERIERFKGWLTNCEHETIVVVGHSQYFKKMLDQPTLMRNVDVWEVTLKIGSSGSNGGALTWHDLQLRYRTELADEHPYDKLQANLRNGSNNNSTSAAAAAAAAASPTSATSSSTKKKSRWEDEDDDDEVINDLSEEPICRICQMTAAEMPNMRLIKPCRCIGSLQLSPSLTIHSIDTPYQHTLSTHSNTLSTYPIDTPYQHTQSTHSINTHAINIPYQHIRYRYRLIAICSFGMSQSMARNF